MGDKTYRKMDDDELRRELLLWEKNVETAPGWPSAYFAAKQVEQIVSEGNRRGLGMVNNFPIQRG